MCPIKRSWEQMLYFGPDELLFVSRQAIGRKQRRSDIARILRIFSTILELEHTYGNLSEKPRHMDDMDFERATKYRAFLYEELILASNGVPDIGEIHKSFFKKWLKGNPQVSPTD
jgi:hypothetical protein